VRDGTERHHEQHERRGGVGRARAATVEAEHGETRGERDDESEREPALAQS
jgi:hypothetical protein